MKGAYGPLATELWCKMPSCFRSQIKVLGGRPASRTTRELVNLTI